ncbi:hypothetical protein, partial [Xenorhabdus bovienii]|uniref:hypothetical protein n=1 Tax=Xenorhabdus bovienii TaxID=40576 RepID=UPI0023B3374A
ARLFNASNSSSEKRTLNIFSRFFIPKNLLNANSYYYKTRLPDVATFRFAPLRTSGLARESYASP